MGPSGGGAWGYALRSVRLGPLITVQEPGSPQAQMESVVACMITSRGGP
jgi:hypothetical protein